MGAQEKPQPRKIGVRQIGLVSPSNSFYLFGKIITYCNNNSILEKKVKTCSNIKHLFNNTYSLYRGWKKDRGCCQDQDYMPSDSELFLNAAKRIGMEYGLALKTTKTCLIPVSNKMHDFHDHITGCIDAAEWR